MTAPVGFAATLNTDDTFTFSWNAESGVTHKLYYTAYLGSQ